MLVLYTDGLTEARDPDGALFGEQRVLDVLDRAAPASAKAATAALRDAVERFAPDLRDDLQLLSVSFAGAAARRRLPDVGPIRGRGAARRPVRRGA